MSSRENLKIDHVQIHTASLSIRHFMVSNRKMTLSVFRQIMPEQIINEETMELRGVPWGRVNYFWEGARYNSQGDERNEIHVVWQKGDDLRRCVVGSIRLDLEDIALAKKEMDGDVITDEGRELNEMKTYLLGGARKIELRMKFRPNPQRPVDVFESEFYHVADITDGYRNLSHNLQTAIVRQVIEEAKEEIVNAEAKAAAERIEYMQLFNRLHKSLCDLPQIYIAV